MTISLKNNVVKFFFRPMHFSGVKSYQYIEFIVFYHVLRLESKEAEKIIKFKKIRDTNFSQVHTPHYFIHFLFAK